MQYKHLCFILDKIWHLGTNETCKQIQSTENMTKQIIAFIIPVSTYKSV